MLFTGGGYSFTFASLPSLRLPHWIPFSDYKELLGNEQPDERRSSCRRSIWCRGICIIHLWAGRVAEHWMYWKCNYICEQFSHRCCSCPHSIRNHLLLKCSARLSPDLASSSNKTSQFVANCECCKKLVKKSSFQQLDNYVSDRPAATTPLAGNLQQQRELLHIEIELFVGGDWNCSAKCLLNSQCAPREKCDKYWPKTNYNNIYIDRISNYYFTSINIENLAIKSMANSYFQVFPFCYISNWSGICILLKLQLIYERTT